MSILAEAKIVVGYNAHEFTEEEFEDLKKVVKGSKVSYLYTCFPTHTVFENRDVVIGKIIESSEDYIPTEITVDRLLERIENAKTELRLLCGKEPKLLLLANFN